jgi:hypothetical protein
MSNSLVMCSSAQQQKPNLSGTWTLNLSASKFAAPHKHEHDTYMIKMKEPRLQVTHVTDGRNEIFTYVTDGKEHMANVPGQSAAIRFKAHWDGDTLVIDKNEDSGDFGTTSWTSRYSLSQNGKTLTIIEHVTRSAFSAPFDETLVYDRHQP